MGRPLILPSGFEEHDFLSMMKKEQNGRNRVRLLAMHHLQLGKSQKEVSELVEVYWTTVQGWLKRFKKEGFDGLKEGFDGLFESKRSGAPRKIGSSAEKIISNKIKLLSESKTGGYITGKELQKILLEEHQVECSLRTVYNTLKRLGFSWITSRSIHPKSNRKIQNNYKKNL